jgi:hypothetical protein
VNVERAIDVVFFDLKDTLGEVYRPGELPYENDVLMPAIGALFNDADDVIVSNLIRREGPGDAGPYLALIETLERELRG